MLDTSLPATIGSAFSKTANAFTLHDDSSFESVLDPKTTSIRSNPFNDSVSTFNESTPMKPPFATVAPKKEFEFLSTNNENLNAIFNSYSTPSLQNELKFGNSNNNEKQEFAGMKKNPFSASEKSAWNELSALDFSALQMEFTDGDEKSSIFANMNREQQHNAKTEMKKEIPADLFKDVAMELFSEFNGARPKNNEFFNKISNFDAVRT